ncbi:unnamed protein product [Microthlaspi erraticum]|uniref:F-box associated beta-propeller type 1 domain-containing protein n=1 Tax=Microthlaspi erraticum TaxID=1685480 RepID=A0A6D2IKG7_9BRAS|nr:unnamed protein product [Microthlaspi erraticum]
MLTGSREEEEPKSTRCCEFDFSTERFQNHYLPFHEAECLGPFVLKEALNNLALSVVKEDRLCLFYESATKSKTEIWMSSEIGETASVSWFKYLAEDASRFSRGT